MTRGVAIASLALVCVAALVGCDDDTTPPKPAATATAVRKQLQTAQEIKDCRDDCEQTAVVGGNVDDDALRACRARCEGRSAGSGSSSRSSRSSGVVGGNPGYEVPRSVTRAPANHNAPAVRPLGP